ncbi:hypothetical protein ETB97_001989 [Aspergillus alliaceus]|uniref:Methyltransferase domain-containing protein n=1 Tax=Petromyces alliaceus TaxID=209559 RepID=A0A8H6E5F2_PETAA|nr:hypothetical protein ETB97_001989 [Aspergillus burnettii]
MPLIMTTLIQSPLYQDTWVQKLLQHIQDFLQVNSDWFGIDPFLPQRVLDYACGNGTVSSALLANFPNATFQGIDISTSQATSTIHTHPGLSDAQWSAFDVCVISFALHHTKDPVDLLKRLRQRVRTRGTVVVVDFLKQPSGGHTAQQQEGRDQKYNAADMVKLPQGMKIWPGFTVQDIHADMASSGCVDVEGMVEIFIARATAT